MISFALERARASCAIFSNLIKSALCLADNLGVRDREDEGDREDDRDRKDDRDDEDDRERLGLGL